MISAALLAQLASMSDDEIRAIVTDTLARSDAPPGPAPNVEIVGKDHFLFDRPGARERVAMAARDPQGGEWVLVNRDANAEDAEPVLQHETAHLVDWRKNGEKVKEHGPSFMRECRNLVTTRPSYYCKRN